MFQIDDEVVDFARGEGIVVDIGRIKDYPVLVKFSNSRQDKYTSDGKFYIDDIRPSLYHKGTEFIVKEPKRSKWVNIYYHKMNNKFYTGSYYDSKEEAEKEEFNKEHYIKTIEIKPEEYEGKM